MRVSSWLRFSGTEVNNGTSTATITGLDAGAEYTYNVYYRSTRTEDSDKAAHWDVKVKFTTATPPAKPTGLSVTRGNASVTLSWTPPPTPAVPPSPNTRSMIRAPVLTMLRSRGAFGK